MIIIGLMMSINFVRCSNLRSIKSVTLADEVLGKFLKNAIEPVDIKSKQKLQVYVTRTIRLIRKCENVKKKLDSLETARLCVKLIVRMKNADELTKILKTEGISKEDKVSVEVDNYKIQEKCESLEKEYECLKTQKEHCEQRIVRLKSDIVEMCALFFDSWLTQSELRSFFEEDLKSVMKNAGKRLKSISLHKKCLISKTLDE